VRRHTRTLLIPKPQDPNPNPTPNKRRAGNFSIQVLNTAVSRSHGLSLVPSESEGLTGRVDADPSQFQAFVLNQSQHWITLRRYGDTWLDLNSMHDKPRVVSAFYLSAFLHQLVADGYNIFCVEGELPPPLQDPTMGDPSCFHVLASLLEGSGGAGGQEKEKDNWGAGQVLGSASRPQGFGLGAGAAEDDEDLQMALAMSMQDAAGAAAGDGEASVLGRLPAELPAEPARDAASADFANIKLRLPDGKQLRRKFRREEPVSLLWVLVKQELGIEVVELAKHQMRAGATGNQLDLSACLVSELTFDQAGLAPSAAVRVVL